MKWFRNYYPILSVITESLNKTGVIIKALFYIV